MYFRNDKERTPRDTLTFRTSKSSSCSKVNSDMSIEPAPDHPTAIDIFMSSNQFSLTKKRTRVSLMAESSRDIKIWACLIRSYAGIEFPPIDSESINSSRAVGSNAGVVQTVSPQLRQAALDLRNDRQESVLHRLCQQQSSFASPEGSDQEAVEAAAWLLNNGCSANSVDSSGLQPVHWALQTAKPRLALLLASGGGQLGDGPLSEGVTATLTANPGLQEQMDSAYMAHCGGRQEMQFLSKQVTLRGFTYLSLIFLAHLIHLPR